MTWATLRPATPALRRGGPFTGDACTLVRLVKNTRMQPCAWLVCSFRVRGDRSRVSCDISGIGAPVCFRLCGILRGFFFLGSPAVPHFSCFFKAFLPPPHLWTLMRPDYPPPPLHTRLPHVQFGSGVSLDPTADEHGNSPPFCY